jgi:hypothetical protein
MIPFDKDKHTEMCKHEFGKPHRYSRIHSEITCKLCGHEEFIPTPEHMKAEPDWQNAIEVVS